MLVLNGRTVAVVTTRTAAVVLAVIAGVLMAAVAGMVVAGALSSGSSDGDVSHARYVEIRAECERRATVALPPQFAPGGQRWVDLVNACMVDHP